MINSPEEIKQQVNNPIGVLTLRHDNIITFIPNEGETSTSLDILKSDLIIFLEWTKGKKMGFLTDNRNLKALKAEERLFVQENLPNFSSKLAMVVDGGISYYFFNIILLFNRPEVPMKAFKDGESAIKWLQE